HDRGPRLAQSCADLWRRPAATVLGHDRAGAHHVPGTDRGSCRTGLPGDTRRRAQLDPRLLRTLTGSPRALVTATWNRERSRCMTSSRSASGTRYVEKRCVVRGVV